MIYSNKDQGGQDRLEIGEYLACARCLKIVWVTAGDTHRSCTVLRGCLRAEELESPDDAVDAFGLNVYSWCGTAAVGSRIFGAPVCQAKEVRRHHAASLFTQAIQSTMMRQVAGMQYGVGSEVVDVDIPPTCQDLQLRSCELQVVPLPGDC